MPTLATVRIVAGSGAAHRVVVDPASGRAFVTRSEANRVDVFDTASLTTLASIKVADDVDGAVFDPAGSSSSTRSMVTPGLATLIDPATQSVVGTIGLGGKPEFAVFDPQTRLIYQNLADRDVAAVVDVAKRAVIDRWPLVGCHGPSGIALDPAGRRLFVVCSRTLSWSSWTSPRIGSSRRFPPAAAQLSRLRSGAETDLRDREVRSSFGRAAGGPDAYRALTAVNLHYGAHTLAIDPATHRVYVAYASLILPPRLAVFEPLR